MATLNLSDLKTGVAHPLENSQSSGKCLIHMKLTDQCTKSIDALVHSRKVSVCVNCHVVTFCCDFCTGCFFFTSILCCWRGKYVYVDVRGVPV